MLPRHRGEYVIHMVAHEAWCWIGAKDVRFPRHKQRNNLIRIHIYAWIRIVDIHNSNCGYR